MNELKFTELCLEMLQDLPDDKLDLSFYEPENDNEKVGCVLHHLAQKNKLPNVMMSPYSWFIKQRYSVELLNILGFKKSLYSDYLSLEDVPKSAVMLELEKHRDGLKNELKFEETKKDRRYFTFNATDHHEI